MLNKAIFLMGPTAAGKTNLAVRLLETFPCEIISVDSALVYKGMDIGTAKPDAVLLKKAPHRLINLCDPSQNYSVANFLNDALAAIKDIQTMGKIPLLVGGTGLYFRALEQGLSSLPAADANVRAQLLQEATTDGWDQLHQRLCVVDPVAGLRIHPNDKQRVQRALEVYMLSGTSMTDLQKQTNTAKLAFPVLKLICSTADRDLLRKRIVQRFEQMLTQGFEAEVRALYQRDDLTADLPAIRAVGYRQMWSYLADEVDYEAMKVLAITATQQLAKRQLTWLRKESNAIWLDNNKPNMINEVQEIVLKYIYETPSIRG